MSRVHKAQLARQDIKYAHPRRDEHSRLVAVAYPHVRTGNTFPEIVGAHYAVTQSCFSLHHEHCGGYPFAGNIGYHKHERRAGECFRSCRG